MLTLQKLQEELTVVARRCEQLESRQEWIERVFETYGIRGLWLSPSKASPLLGISEDRIEGEIRRAERARALKQKSDVQYGTHYRDVRELDKIRGSWQVHVGNFDKLLTIPPDQRVG